MSDQSILSLLPSYIQATAIIIAGGWAYWRFFYQRANEPATDIDIDLRFVGVQVDKWVIEVTSFLKNQSLVRVEYEDFQVSIRYLLPDDKIQDGSDKVFYQVDCPRSINSRLEKGVTRKFGNVDYINPRQEFRHRYITHVPAAATFVWVQCRFWFKNRKKEKINSQRIFRVPMSEEFRTNQPNTQV
jgi:hypothetical protein